MKKIGHADTAPQEALPGGAGQCRPPFDADHPAMSPGRTAELEASLQALAESEAKYRRLFETVSDAVLVFDAETRQLIEVNAAALRLYGYSRKEFLSLRHSDVTADPEDSEAAIQMTLAGLPHHIPLRYHRKKDGKIFPTEIATSSFVLGGRPVMCGIVRDITARRQAEEALRRREQELADFFAESPLGLLCVGPDGRIHRANQAQLDLLGCSAEEVLGLTVAELHVEAQAIGDLLTRLAKKETVQNYRVRLRHKNGSVKHVLIDANGFWEKDRLVHSRWFVRDITRNVTLEREILNISERERRRLGQDLHDDLCQQLAGIEFLSQTLANHLAKRSKSAAAQAQEIAQMVQRAMTQTRELARGLSPVPLEAEGLTDALRELAARIKTIFRRDCRFHSAPPVLVPDHNVAIHLYHIAQEAVGNALKHAQATSIEVGLAAEGKGVSLRVSDNGTGDIPHQPRKRKGMGLQIMQHRAAVLGGTLLVQATVGAGTTIVCTVPDGLLPAEARNLK